MKFFVREEERVKAELQSMIDTAAARFPAVRHGSRGDVIRQRRVTEEGDVIV